MRGTSVGNPRWRTSICTRKEEDGAPSAVRVGSEARMKICFAAGWVGSFRDPFESDLVKMYPKKGGNKLLAPRTERKGKERSE